MAIYKNPLELANAINEKPRRPAFEAGLLDDKGQVIDSMAQFFDNEDEAIDFATQNNYNYVTGYEYDDDEYNDLPKSSYNVWEKKK